MPTRYSGSIRSNSTTKIKGAVIKRLRLARGYSQAALAQAAGISLSSVRAAELQGRVSIAIAAALVHTLAGKARSTTP